MLFYETNLQSDAGQFRATVDQCADPDCPCGELQCKLVELPSAGASEDEPRVISFRVDPETWQEIEPPARSPQETDLVREFLRDYPDEERDELQMVAREKLRIARVVREYRLPARDCAEGVLVPFSQILAHPKRGARERTAWMGHYEHEGRRYLVDDLYCANPECLCEEAHLAFLRVSPDESRVETHFLATVSFGGRVKITEVAMGPKKRAQQVLSAFWEELGASELDRLKRRYGQVKQIAARSVKPRRTAALFAPLQREALDEPEEPEQPRAPRVGRNDPCPCGSGKKFKRCCGPKQRAAGS